MRVPRSTEVDPSQAVTVCELKDVCVSVASDTTTIRVRKSTSEGGSMAIVIVDPALAVGEQVPTDAYPGSIASSNRLIES